MKNYKNAQELTKQKLSHPTYVPCPGLILRDARMKLTLTLEEACHEICTSSYLSRLETGEVKCNPSLLKQLYQRLKIPENFTSTDPYDWIPSFQQALYQNQEKTLLQLIERDMTPYYYQKVLQRFIFHLTYSSVKEAMINYRYLLAFQQYMPLDELKLFYHYVGLYFRRNHHHTLAIYYFSLAYRIHQKMATIDGLLSLHFSECYFQCGKATHGIHHLQDALNFFADHYMMKYKMDCELLLCDYYIKNKMLTQAKPLLFKLYAILKQNDHYGHMTLLLNTMGHYYTEIQQYENAERSYHHALKLNPNLESTLLSLLELYHHQNETVKQSQLIQLLKKQDTSLNPKLKVACIYYEYLTAPTQSDEFRIFLQKKAIPLAKQSGHYRYYYKYTYSLMQYYESTGKYKSALKVFHDLNNETFSIPFMD